MSRPTRDGASAAAPPRILVEGETCWRLARAERASVLIDGSAYFRALLDSLRLARERIVVLGWDFDPRIRLDPGEPATELRRLLPALLADRPALEIYVLVWDVSIVFGPSSAIAPLIDREWCADPRLHIRFDGHHPPGASQHEKIVCIDDNVAFVGGIDLTVGRWDTPRHAAAETKRASPDGESCPPVHDLQMAIAGDGARAVAQLARERWQAAGGRTLDACRTRAVAWPASAEAWLADAAVGIARTRPPSDGRPAIDEIARLNEAALRSARRHVYIEAQYLCASSVADALETLLRRDEGPDVTLLVWRETTGWLERIAMGSNRDRLLRRLACADRHGRLRAYSLVSGDDPQVEVKLHAKLVIVDDVFVRIGSSNMNNRSLGVDTECDLAIEASAENARRGADVRAAIRRLRDTLLAEHLGSTPEEVGRALAADRPNRAIDALNAAAGRLRPYPLDADGETDGEATGTNLIDPEEPLDAAYLLRELRDRLLPG